MPLSRGAPPLASRVNATLSPIWTTADAGEIETVSGGCAGGSGVVGVSVPVPDPEQLARTARADAAGSMRFILSRLRGASTVRRAGPELPPGVDPRSRVSVCRSPHSVHDVARHRTVRRERLRGPDRGDCGLDWCGGGLPAAAGTVGVDHIRRARVRGGKS